MLIISILATVVFCLLIIESYLINRSVKRIKCRLHVNGTRGKTSVAKYICAILRDNNFRTMGKVTGDFPAMIYPDGKTSLLNRKGPARVQEQFKIIFKAAKQKADALVLECMSINPVLQKLESKFFKPDVYIITNIKDDHQEVMGNTINEQIKSITDAIPPKCVVIAPHADYLETIVEKSNAQGAHFIEKITLNPQEKENIPDFAHLSNVELAITAAVQCGVKRENALNALKAYLNKEKETLVYHLSEGTRPYFLNAFSVNDTDSTSDVFNKWKYSLSPDRKTAIVFNTRSDRPLRTKLFSEWLITNKEYISTIVLIGTHQPKAYNLLKPLKVHDVKISKVFSKQTPKIRAEIAKLCSDNELVVGIGNYKGDGRKLVTNLQKTL